jgi:transposase-like protein
MRTGKIIRFLKCFKCYSVSCIKNGFVRNKQRYRCKQCCFNFIEVDDRNKYDNKTRNLAIRMCLNNCGFRRISEILGVPLSTNFSWVKKACQIVDEMVGLDKKRFKLHHTNITKVYLSFFTWLCC